MDPSAPPNEVRRFHHSRGLRWPIFPFDVAGRIDRARMRRNIFNISRYFYRRHFTCLSTQPADPDIVRLVIRQNAHGLSERGRGRCHEEARHSTLHARSFVRVR